MTSRHFWLAIDQLLINTNPIMKQQTVRIGVDLERELDGDLTKWAAQEERSKRVQVRRIVRHVVRAWKRDPNNAALQSIGLVNEEDHHGKGLLA